MKGMVCIGARGGSGFRGLNDNWDGGNGGESKRKMKHEIEARSISYFCGYRDCGGKERGAGAQKVVSKTEG